LAQVDRVLARPRVGVAEDLDAREPDRGGDAVAVRVEVVRRLVGDPIEVHLDAVDDRLERRARDRVGAHGGLEPHGDRMGGGRARLVAARHVLQPALEVPAPGRRVCGTLGGAPVTRATASIERAADHATQYGIRTRGGRIPAISERRAPISASEMFRFPRMYFSPIFPRSAARRWPRATSRT